MAATAGGEEEAFPSASASASPRSSAPVNSENRLKFLCSYGGKIFPSSSDGHLKYVGGHTRLLFVSRFVSFSELKQRIEEMTDCSLAAIKYELAVDGFDCALVSIGGDEDLAHMIDEYDRLELAFPSSSARFRFFLFPSAPSSPSSPNNAAAVSSPSSAPTSPSSTIDGPAALGLNGHCVRSTPNMKGDTLIRQMSLGATRAPRNKPQNHLLCRQRSAGALPYRSQGVPAGAFVCGSRVALQPASRGRFHNGGGGLQPLMSTSPLRSPPRKHIIW